MPKADPEQERRHQQERLLQLAVRREVAKASDELASEVKEPAESMTKAPKLDTTQVRNLENLAYTTDKISDITDWLKRQIGRSGRDERWRYNGVGQRVLDALVGLRGRADRIVTDLRSHKGYGTIVDNDLPRRVHLDLCREYVKHLTAEFLYHEVRQQL